MQPNIIVFYGKAGYFTAAQETEGILKKMGGKPETSLLSPGILGVQSTLKPRQVIEELRELYLSDPQSIKASTRWIPVDYTCNTDIKEIKEVIREDINYLIKEEEKYKLDYNEHGLKISAEKEIRNMLSGKIEKERPEKILRIDVFEEVTCITLMRPKDIFEISES